MKFLRSNVNKNGKRNVKDVQKTRGLTQHKKIAFFLLISAFAGVSYFHSSFVCFCEEAEDAITLSSVAEELKTIAGQLPSESKVQAKANRIKGILEEINNLPEQSKISTYRLSRIKSILKKDMYDEVDYSVTALIEAEKVSWGYEDSPIGMATVQSRLNEIADLIVRSLVLDEIGNSTDEPQENTGTIWARLNKLAENNAGTIGSASDLSLDSRDPAKLPLAPFLNFIRNQLTGMIPLLESTDVTGILNQIKALNSALSTQNFDSFRTCLTEIYEILVNKAKGISLESIPSELGNNYVTAPNDSTYSLSQQYGKTQSLISDLSNSLLVDVSRIARVGGYLWPRLVDEIDALIPSTGEEVSDRIQQECRISVGTLTQPGLTLMNCLTEICQVIFAETIEGSGDDRGIFENSPFLGLIEQDNRSLFSSGSLSKTALHRAIQNMAKDQTEEPLKSLAVSGLDANASYDYADLVECILYPSSEGPDAYEELYTVPLINKLPKTSSSDSWFLLSSDDATEQYVPYILKKISPFLGDEISASGKTLYENLNEKMDSNVSQIKYDLLDPVFDLVKQYKEELEGIVTASSEMSGYVEKYWTVLENSKKESNPVDLFKILQKSKEAKTRASECSKKETELTNYLGCKADVEKFAVLSKNFEDACELCINDPTEIKKELVSQQYEELEKLKIAEKIDESATELTDYKDAVQKYMEGAEILKGNIQVSTSANQIEMSEYTDVENFHTAEKNLLSAIYTKESELDFLQGNELDHPADITLYGLLNGILFECGAQLLLNYIGTACDAGDSDGSLYAKTLALETDAFVDSLGNDTKLTLIETNANSMRSALSDLVGTIRYKYKDVMYGSAPFNNVLTTLSQLQSGTGWGAEGNPLGEGDVESFCGTIDSVVKMLLGE